VIRLGAIVLAAVVGVAIAVAARDEAPERAVAPAAERAATVRLRRVANVDQPVHVAAPRNERGRIYIVEKTGRIRVLESGRLRAALDVTDPEPLPEDHPLWTAPGALVVPHVGGASSAMRPRAVKLIRTQIERMLAGEPPLNVVYES
jgi:hypothetical protein